MNKYKIPQIAVILLLVLVIFGFSIYYAIASYNEALEITGSVYIRGMQSWRVAFNQSSYTEFQGSVVGTTNIGQTTLTSSFNLEDPGDYYEFSIDVENTGNIDALLNSITISVDQNDYLDVTVKYGNMTFLSSSSSFSIPLDVGDSEVVYVKVAYKTLDQLTSLPATDTNINVVVALGYQSTI